MRVYCAKNYELASRKAANLISAQILVKPDCVLGLATGSTPLGTYRYLIDWYRRKIWISVRCKRSIWMNTGGFLRKTIRAIAIL